MAAWLAKLRECRHRRIGVRDVLRRHGRGDQVKGVGRVALLKQALGAVVQVGDVVNIVAWTVCQGAGGGLVGGKQRCAAAQIQ